MKLLRNGKLGGLGMGKEVTLNLLEEWLVIDAEHETLEFKAATSGFDKWDVVRYSVAISNERGGHLVLGVTNEAPRKIVGTAAFLSANDINEIKLFVRKEGHVDVRIDELTYSGKRVLVFTIPSRPLGVPLQVGDKGEYLSRSGESLIGMGIDKMKAILAETDSGWLLENTTDTLTAEQVIELLDCGTLFNLMGQQVPGSAEATCERLVSLDLTIKSKSGFAITNLGALVAARSLTAISSKFAPRLPRFILYKGVKNRIMVSDDSFDRGYAVGFEDLVQAAFALTPKVYNEDVVRTLVSVFTIQSFRELIANALIHQDFSITGVRVTIEIYDDRVEFSNPGVPLIDTRRFIDGYKSRNEVLANLMRRLGICEERSSGIDKVVEDAEISNLPAPEFRSDDSRTTVLLFGKKDFSEMTPEERIRACYQHCCLLYVSNSSLSNQSLRERFAFSGKEATASDIISATIAAGLIELIPIAKPSKRYARYRPFWAV